LLNALGPNTSKDRKTDGAPNGAEAILAPASQKREERGPKEGNEVETTWYPDPVVTRKARNQSGALGR